jgi:uncharacterized protein YutE (UPF0331/DUF86 family)
MSPEVIERKLAMLGAYRTDLELQAASAPIEKAHYAVERLIQLIVERMYDVCSHWLADRGFVHPDSYAEVFEEAGAKGFLTAALAGNLASAARMRNLLVHAYERIDLEKLSMAIPSLLADSLEFTRQAQAFLDHRSA